MNIIGIDTLKFGLDIKEYRKSYDRILSDLKEKKEMGQEIGNKQPIIYNNVFFDVELTGIRFYAYNISNRDFSLAFAERVTKENPEVTVSFRSSFLWSYGYDNAYEKFINWYNYFPGKIEKTRISRLDICMDTDEIEFNKEDSDLFITRAKEQVTYDVHKSGNKVSGFSIGKGKPIMARIYNKSEEIKKSGKEWFKTLWKENGWDEKKDVWRIEFQLRRGVLKELGIDRVEDIEGNMDSLWKYLTVQWLKMDHDKWDVTIHGKTSNIEPLVRKKVIKGDLGRLTSQTNGILISIAAYGGMNSIESTMLRTKAALVKSLKAKNTTFEKEVQKRREKFIEHKGIALEK